ncbi:MAG: phosphomethylpyrimidine synthase ThiC [Elusimicrobiota bacterium]
MRQIESARKNVVTKEMWEVAKHEQVSVDFIRKGVADGTIVILKNDFRLLTSNFRLVGIGKKLKIKVNANIGTSPLSCNVLYEKQKLFTAIKYGADTVMDLSTGGDVAQIRRTIIKHSTVPVGTVPIYALVCQASKKRKKFPTISIEQMFYEIESQLADGVDFITVHCGITLKALEILKKKKRLIGIVSRGGAFLAEWMLHNKKENPLYENFDNLLKIVKKYDAVISLGDGLRPGCIADNTDLAQIEELKILGELQRYALKRNVQTMIEGPGHIPINNIEKNVLLEKKYCHNAPFYVLGPLTTDIAPGYDHITAAIGGALAGYYGADFLCYVTPAEHLALPTIEDVKNGVIASRIAAHCARIARGNKNAIRVDYELSKARKNFNWKKQKKLSIDPSEFEKRCSAKNKEVCSMCGSFCAMKRKLIS